MLMGKLILREKAGILRAEKVYAPFIPLMRHGGYFYSAHALWGLLSPLMRCVASPASLGLAYLI